ncbi:hypothetical protein [Herbiconiux liangxiaofengii]|uniref:hypothetical protein n=1 Tax=Herbiconiux liangxiaofengii TaxID=3342795 RepID=UPI0035B757E0
MLAAAFPSPGLIDRRTGDADAGISLEVAAGGTMHQALLDADYEAESGNRYVFGEPPEQRVIDLLVPAAGGRFTTDDRGGRRFDAMPGLSLAMSTSITVEAHLTLLDGSELVCDVPLPTVEAAVVLKAYAWRGRGMQTPKDIIDLSNLLQIIDAHGAETVGGWRLNESGITGSRGDASVILADLALKVRAGRATPPSVDRRKFEVLLRRWVMP